MRVSEFKKFIQSLEEEELHQEMIKLYIKFKVVKDHYAMELGSNKDRTKIYANAKKEIIKRYATKSYRKPRKPRIRKINSILTEMSIKAIFEHEMIDLYLFNAETGNEFIKNYDLMTTPIFNTIAKSFDSAINIILRSLLEEEYETRCQNIVNNCTNYELRRTLRGMLNRLIE